MKNKPCKDAFVKNYVLTGLKNGKQAAIDAGYSAKTADQAASRLLKDVKVIAAIKEFQKAGLKLSIKTKEQKLIILEDVMAKCSIQDTEKGMLNPNAVIAAIKEHNLMQGDNAPIEVINDNAEIKEIKITVVKGND
jgi:phage terminase small subunit